MRVPGSLPFSNLSLADALEFVLAAARPRRLRARRARVSSNDAATGGGVAAILAAAGIAGHEDAHAAPADDYALAASAEDILAFAAICAPGAQFGENGGAIDHALHERGGLDAPYVNEAEGCAAPFASRYGGLEAHDHADAAGAHAVGDAHHDGARHQGAASATTAHTGHAAAAASGGAAHAHGGAETAAVAAAPAAAHEMDHAVAGSPADHGEHGAHADGGAVEMAVDLADEVHAHDVAIDLDHLDIDEGLAALLGDAEAPADPHAGHQELTLADAFDDPLPDAIAPPPPEI